jgi:ABC-type polysaccharide/polyol phosphate transport system ATPase subunit
MSSRITFTNVTKQFPIQTDRTAKEIIPSLLKGGSWAEYKSVLTNVSFSFEEGEAIGIVGKNGAGKSTILKLIAGVTYPNKGTINVKGTVAPLIELGAGFHHELTGLENIYLNGAILGMNKKDIDANVDAIIEFSELGEYINVPVKRYSTGMLMRLGFSVAVQTTASVILIDEVLAVGDAEFQKKCLDHLMHLKEQKKITFVFVSHDQRQVEQFCDRALLLEGGKIVVDGKPKEVFARYGHQLD